MVTGFRNFYLLYKRHAGEEVQHAHVGNIDHPHFWCI